MNTLLVDPPHRPAPSAAAGLTGVLFVFACVEVASGVLQGYYAPLFKDVAVHLDVSDADVNWLETGQLAFAAFVVPPLARLGDLVGHRRVLLLATLVTAVASWAIAFAPGFGTMLVAWAVQGTYVVWLPLEVAIIHRRTAGDDQQARRTRRAASVLVAVLEVAIIVGAVVAGLLVDRVSMTTVLMLPAVVVTLALPAIWLGLAEVPPLRGGRFDWAGLGLLLVAVGTVLGGLVAIRVAGPGSPAAWALVVAGLLAFVPWGRFELRSPHPLVDLRVVRRAAQWPVQVAAGLLGMTILGAQVPMSTYARTDPDVAGYGLGVSAAEVSGRIALYVLCLAAGALLLPVLARLVGPRVAMAGAFLLSATGYAAWIVSHDSPAVTLGWLALTGCGAGGLVAAVLAAAVAAAPAEHAGMVAGLTNAAKTIGGAVAAAVFALCLTPGGAVGLEAGDGTLGGYYAVWSICAATGVVGAALLLLTRRGATAA